MNRLYAWSTVAFGVRFVAIGVALLGATAAAGGGVLGFVLGALFLALGVARLTLHLRMRR